MGTIPMEAQEILKERFGHDTLLSLATVDGDQPFVRTVNAYYEDGAFYVITHGLSNKMKQIAKNPRVAVSGDWFTAQGVGVNLGYFGKAENRELAEHCAGLLLNGSITDTTIFRMKTPVFSVFGCRMVCFFRMVHAMILILQKEKNKFGTD